MYLLLNFALDLVACKKYKNLTHWDIVQTSIKHSQHVSVSTWQVSTVGQTLVGRTDHITLLPVVC